jgi:hypothetical protein
VATLAKLVHQQEGETNFTNHAAGGPISQLSLYQL